MSDFFSGVYGAKFPEVVMNSGPLPPADGLPAPLHDTADARINYNSTLLGNLDPYAYGEPGYLSSQVSYVNQPHRIQKIIPPLRLPCPQVNAVVNFDISHAVDDSDIAFVMRLDRASTICSMLGAKGAARHRVSTSLDAFINLPTLNYLLAGIQLCYIPTHDEKSKWFDLLHDLDQSRYEHIQTRLGLDDIRHIVRDLIRPFGVVRGSEKQGGQDETGLASATWPVNFVANLVLDGKERNIVNVWHNHDISAGDDLVLRLRPMPIPGDRDGGYTLNHYYKRYVQQNFSAYMQHTLGHPRATHVWQLVPDIFSLDFQPENDVTNGAYPRPGVTVREPLPDVVMSPGFEVPQDYVWQEHGFWHIGRSQVMVRRFAHREYYFNDMANNLKINHLDMTFEPTWTKVPGEERDSGHLRAVRDPARAGRGLDRINVAPGVMSQADFGPNKRVRWAPQLQLEQFLRAPMPQLDGARDTGAPAGGDPYARLFAAPASSTSSGDAYDRLFAAPASSTSSGDAYDRLFAAPAKPSASSSSGDAYARLFAAPADARPSPASLCDSYGAPFAAPGPASASEESELPPLRAMLLSSEQELPPPPPPAQGLGAMLSAGAARAVGKGKKKPAPPSPGDA